MLYAFMAVVVVLTAAATGASVYMLNFSLSPESVRGRAESAYASLYRHHGDLRPWVDSLRENGALRDTFVTMPGGERHHAIYLRNDSAHGRTAVLVHGYKTACQNMLHIGRVYHEVMGFNILLPDLHAHGESEGSCIGMGWDERWDVLHWAAVAERLFRDSVQPSRQVIHGLSMGAAATMNVSGENTPAYIRCFVEDCGYTSVWDEFASEAEKRFGLPEFPLMYTTSALCKLLYGWSFGEASSLEQVRKCRKPMLFIHGEADKFVPTRMVHSLFEAKPQPKELWIAPKSKHARSFGDHKEEYVRRVKAFVGKYM